MSDHHDAMNHAAEQLRRESKMRVLRGRCRLLSSKTSQRATQQCGEIKLVLGASAEFLEEATIACCCDCISSGVQACSDIAICVCMYIDVYN